MKYLLFVILLSLAACLLAPEPLIIEQPVACVIPPLRSRELLPTIKWLPQEGSEFRCLSEGEYEKLKQYVAILRSHEIYLIESYNAARNRCSGEE